MSSDSGNEDVSMKEMFVGNSTGQPFGNLYVFTGHFSGWSPSNLHTLLSLILLIYSLFILLSKQLVWEPDLIDQVVDWDEHGVRRIELESDEINIRVLGILDKLQWVLQVRNTGLNRMRFIRLNLRCKLSLKTLQTTRYISVRSRNSRAN